jgi:TnpA family transposase
VTRVLQRDGNPTPLGEAIKHCGRIHESLRIIPLIDDESYRREVKWIRNLKGGRHAHARRCSTAPRASCINATARLVATLS